MHTGDVKIEEDMENQVVKLLSPKVNKELLVRKIVGPSPFFEVVWPNDKKPKGIEGVFTSQGMAMKAALYFLSHMKVSTTVKRDNNTKAREERKVVNNATESNS